MVESLAVATRLGFLKQSPNALQSNEASITDAHEASILNVKRFGTPINVEDTISASEAQTMSKNNYYTSCLKDKRFLALLIEAIFYVIVLVACIALLVEVIHG